RQDRQAQAEAALSRAIGHADSRLAQAPQDYNSLDFRGLALCGLVLIGDPDARAGALESFREARRLTSAPGIVDRTLRLLNEVAAAGPEGALDEVAAATSGRRTSARLKIPSARTVARPLLARLGRGCEGEARHGDGRRHRPAGRARRAPPRD